jgi:hypothetical protein
VLAGVLGTKLASLGHWPILGDLAVESRDLRLPAAGGDVQRGGANCSARTRRNRLVRLALSR